METKRMYQVVWNLIPLSNDKSYTSQDANELTSAIICVTVFDTQTAKSHSAQKNLDNIRQFDQLSQIVDQLIKECIF
jgi:hypothetical protein